MKKKNAFFKLVASFAFLFIVLFTIGCDNSSGGGSGNSAALVGTWVNNYGGYSYEFYSDGNGIQWDEYKFTYSVKGSTVTLTFNDSKTFNFAGGNTVYVDGDMFTRTNGSESSIVGTWEYEEYDTEEDETYKTVAVFNQNNTVKISFYYNDRIAGQESFPWTQDGTMITMHGTYTEKLEYNGGDTFIDEYGDTYTKQ